MKKLAVILFVCALSVFGVAIGGTIDYPIIFEENPTTGYEWTYAISDEAVLAVEDNGYTAAESTEPVAGAGGTHIWVVSGLQEGEASITFTYARSWESEPADPVVVYTFSVDADQNLTVVSVTGLPEKYMPYKAVVQLIENPTTGYLWEAETDQDGILALDSDTYEADEAATEQVGVGGVHTWIYSGVAEGKVTLTFRYARSFEPDEEPAATVMLTYQVDSALYVTLLSIDGDYEQYDSDAATVQE